VNVCVCVNSFIETARPPPPIHHRTLRQLDRYDLPHLRKLKASMERQCIGVTKKIEERSQEQVCLVYVYIHAGSACAMHACSSLFLVCVLHCLLVYIAYFVDRAGP
jgi:hypothetical protein